MKDEHLINKVHALAGNLSLVQQFFIEKAGQFEQQKRLIESEQALVNNLLRRWKPIESVSVVDEVPSTSTTLTVTAVPATSSTGHFANSNGSVGVGPVITPILLFDPPTQAPVTSTHYTSHWKERSSTNFRSASASPTISITREHSVVVENSSPGRSPKGKESHVVLRRQTSGPGASPAKQNSQYPVLPKKRKIPLFNATSPVHSSEALSNSLPSKHKVVPEEIVIYPTFESAVSNLEELQSTISELCSNHSLGDDDDDNDSDSQQVVSIDSGSPRRRSSNAMEFHNVISAEDGAEDSEQGNENGDTSDPAVTDVKVVKVESQNGNSVETQPPKLQPVGGERNSNSSKAKPTQGPRKSSRTIRPSWKLNNSSETILPNAIPLQKEERQLKAEAPVSKRKRPQLRGKALSDQPPVLTSQVDIPESTTEDKPEAKPLGNRSKTLQCNQCHKAFSTQHGLRYHIESHLQLKPFKCTICLKSFGQKSTLTRHQATTHTKIKTHICTICKKCFSSRSELQSHKGRHEAKRNVCPACTRSFIDKRYFKSHVRICTAQRERLAESDGNGSPVHALFQCSSCQKNYRDPNYFKKHISLCSSSKPAN